MNAGIGLGGTTTLRVMTSASGTLLYGLFPDPSLAINWGNTLGTNTVSGTSSLTTLVNIINIYGLIPAGQAAPAGNYADTVTMTVTY
jgi:spore coat protein U-like protein